jgi:hypothetical protein
MKVGRKEVLYQVSGLPRLTCFLTMLLLGLRLEPMLDALVASVRNVVVYYCGAQRILCLENRAT